VTARFTGAGTWRFSAAGADVEERTDSVQLNVTLFEPFRREMDPPSLDVRISEGDGTPFVAHVAWDGDPLHVELEVVREPEEGDARTLAAAKLVASDDVLLPGNPVHTLALSALEIVGATMGDPDFPTAAAERLFPPPPPEPEEPDVIATRDWVLFRRRRRIECADARDAIVAQARSYRLYHLRVDDSVALQDVRLALLRNDRDKLQAYQFRSITDVEFEPGLPDLAVDPNDVLADWRAVQPGNLLLLGTIATHGGADGEQLARSRLARLEDALAPVTAPTAATITDTLPYVPDALAPGRDGTIVIVTGAVAKTTCHDVYRVDAARTAEALKYLREGAIEGLLRGDPPLAVRIGEATFGEDGEAPLPDSGTPLADAWNARGDGNVSHIFAFGETGREEAGPEELLRARANAIAGLVGQVTADPEQTQVKFLPAGPGECPAATVLVPELKTICHTVFGIRTENPNVLSIIGSIRDGHGSELARLLKDANIPEVGRVVFEQGTERVMSNTTAELGDDPSGSAPVQKTVFVYFQGQTAPEGEPLAAQAKRIAELLKITDPATQVIAVPDPAMWPPVNCQFVAVAIVGWVFIG
jgi:hypothetical protein